MYDRYQKPGELALPAPPAAAPKEPQQGKGKVRSADSSGGQGRKKNKGGDSAIVPKFTVPGVQRAAKTDRLDMQGAAAAVQSADVDSKKADTEEESKNNDNETSLVTMGPDLSRQRNARRRRDDDSSGP